MKLRIRPNSIRLRLTKSEVTEIDNGGKIKETIELGDELAQHLSYSIVPTDDVENLTVTFEANCISIYIPKSQIAEWAQTDQVGIETKKSIGKNKQLLHILIEKDFSCLEPPVSEEDSDAFPHPRQSESRIKIILEASD